MGEGDHTRHVASLPCGEQTEGGRGAGMDVGRPAPRSDAATRAVGSRGEAARVWRAPQDDLLAVPEDVGAGGVKDDARVSEAGTWCHLPRQRRSSTPRWSPGVLTSQGDERVGTLWLHTGRG